MAILAKKPKGSGGVELGPPAPTGWYQAVCADVIDLGEVPSKFPGPDGKPKVQKTVIVVWQLKAMPRYLVAKWYTNSLHEKAKLRQHLEAWRTKPITRVEEEDGFDLERLIGANCKLYVQQVVKGEKTYANVMAVTPLEHGVARIKSDGYTRSAPVEEPEADEIDPFDDAAEPPPGFVAPAPPVPVDDSDIPFAVLLPLLMTAASLVLA